MAEDQIGQRKETKAPWTKIFTAFKVALDIKKLLLAAGGIFVTAAGWWLLAVVFFNMRSMPLPVDYIDSGKSDAENEVNFKAFRVARGRWNLLYEMAGPAPSSRKEARKFDAGDIATSYLEWKELKPIEDAHEPPPGDKQKEAKSLEKIRAEIVAREGDKKVALEALARYQATIDTGKIKSYGRLRTWPWFEDRGPNPYLLITNNVEPHPWQRGQFVGWFLGHQLPVLVEPLVKFLSPVAYFFDARAGGWNRIYLFGVILWTLAVWGFFGGAITRMAVVQVARNEKISLRDALRFAGQRFQSFFSAPVFPLVFLGVLTFFLILFGLFSGLIPIVGDVLISGLLWPVVIVLGLIMAVVLVGLVGWPLMNATISAEGSDSFDALSRSYSYVYQAPWHYLWYTAVALAYGAVLVFFVGLMGSLMVYLGQWGISQAPFLSSSDPASDREPTYLFVDAPTSFGWRDLLLHSSPYKELKEVITPNGDRAMMYEMNKEYMESMRPWNYIGAFFVSVWLYLLFLVILGFGYSYFWTASTIIYLLMRHKVDDTDLDEIHMEEEEAEEPFAKDMSPAPAVQPAPKATPAGSVTMVDAPALRPVPVATPAPVSTAPTEAPAVENKPAGDGPPPPPTNS